MQHIIIILALSILLAGCAAKTTETVVIETNKGTIEVALDREAAPETVENFVQYVQAGHYDGLVFHRVIPGFMIQGGGFTPAGEQRPTREPITLESGRENLRGTIAMARTNVPDSATSQFFINLDDNAFLNPTPGNPGYAVFGEVTSGMDVVDSIAQEPTEKNGPHDDWPSEEVIIETAKMKTSQDS